MWSHDTNAVAVDYVDAVKDEDLQTMYLNASMKVYTCISTYVVLHVYIDSHRDRGKLVCVLECSLNYRTTRRPSTVLPSQVKAALSLPQLRTPQPTGLREARRRRHNKTLL